MRPLYARIQAVEGVAGRDAVDPKILLALWMFATIEGIGSARQLARLAERDFAYLWICGDVGVNHHLLSDFRTAHGAFLDQLLTDTIATLVHQQVVTLETVAQDGLRVRANAGSSSFRRRKTLEQCQREAAEQVRKLREEHEHEADADASHARRRAAAERAEQVEAAIRTRDALTTPTRCSPSANGWPWRMRKQPCEDALRSPNFPTPIAATAGSINFASAA